ncbi:hypothetical protein Astex_0355 [Asticcacaulis excentricus CB 48]|uniref:Uncharacterized protein n=2 Tax=Asticcacaulis excentricus TaxID=78587 RepID=E8RPS4_ASTEC|nr:hypothetical protein Astex_0355 [Asticcacaulis excentricus CB 48]
MLNYLNKTIIITDVWADGPDDDFRIDMVGNSIHKYTLDEAIYLAEMGVPMRTEHDGYSAPVYIRRHYRSGRYYLTTEADGVPWNNLGHISVHTASIGQPPRIRKLSGLTPKQTESLCTDRGAASFLSGLSASSPPRRSAPSVLQGLNALSGLSRPAHNPSTGFNALAGLSGVFPRR